MKSASSRFCLSILLSAAGIANAQSARYTATGIAGSSPFIGFFNGYANSSYNGVAAVMSPALGLQTTLFLAQDGDQYTAAWNGMFYGTKFTGPNLAPYRPGPATGNRIVLGFGAAWGACPGQVVGYSLQGPGGAFNGSGGPVIFQTPWHATVWGPLGEAGTDLHNANVNSRALACDGLRQVGEADNGQDFSGTMNKSFGSQHAVMWSGTAKSEVDLHGGPFSDSQANGISGAVQVGWGGNTREVQAVNGLSAGRSWRSDS